MKILIRLYHDLTALSSSMLFVQPVGSKLRSIKYSKTILPPKHTKEKPFVGDTSEDQKDQVFSVLKIKMTIYILETVFHKWNTRIQP